MLDRSWAPIFKIQKTDSNAQGFSKIKDSINSYEYNSTGFRGAEHGGKELIAVGCSQTFGEGAPFEALWGTVLAESLGYAEYANLGMRAASISKIVTRTFGYIEEYGNPKYVFCLLPNLERIEHPLVEDFLLSKWNDSVRGDEVQSIHLHPRGTKRPKYLKQPFTVQDTLSQEFVDMTQMDYLKMLDMYCRSNQITFRWSTWDTEFLDLYSKYPQKMPSYVSLKSALASLVEDLDLEDSNCCMPYREKYKENFYVGADHIFDPAEVGHWGVHAHLHAAKEFLASLDRGIILKD